MSSEVRHRMHDQRFLHDMLAQNVGIFHHRAPANSTVAPAPWGQRWDSKGRGKMNGGGDKGKGKVKRNVHRRGKGEKGQGRTCKDP